MSQTSEQNDSFPISLRKIVDNTSEIANGGWGGGGNGIWGQIIGTLSNQTDLQNALNAKANVGSLGMFGTLSTVNSEMATPFVQHPCPAVGTSVTLATFTGAGIVDMVWITLGTNSDGTLMWDGRLQVFTDGAALPDIDTDLGTLFLTALDGHLGSARCAATQHISYGTMGGSGTGMSGGLKFPIPYSNGIVIKLLAPTGSTSHPDSDYTLFTQISNKPGVVSGYRLRSNAVSWINRKTYTKDDIITFFNLTNAAGWLVWQSVAVLGLASSGNTYDYLERIWFWGIDGEPTTPDGNGVVTTKFSSSGGEDLFLYGWYFANAQGVYGTPWTLCTATNNANKTTVAGFDFWASCGGLKFSSALKPGWSLKPSAVINNGHEMSWCFLYYIDTSVPFAPSAPSISATAGDTQATLAITPPTSYGSSAITGYTGTYSPGGGTFTVAAVDTSKVITGLTNGVTYTFSLRAVNSVGTSSPGTTTSTPTSLPFPTITTGTILARYVASDLALSDGASITSWAKTSGTSSISLIQSGTDPVPVFKTSIMNGRAVARFSGAGFSRLVASASFNTAAPTMMICVWKPVALSANQVFDTYPGGAHGRSAGGINGSGLWNTYAGASDAVSAVSPTSAPHIEVMVQNGSSSYVSIDGVKSSTIDAGSGGIDLPLFGVITQLDGDVAEIIVISGNVSDSDRRLIEAYEGTVYNITVT